MTKVEDLLFYISWSLKLALWEQDKYFKAVLCIKTTTKTYFTYTSSFYEVAKEEFVFMIL
jgi:hypothetical protein